MNGLGLLLGHLVGDFVLQTDWLAANKSNPIWGLPHHIASCESEVSGGMVQCQIENDEGIRAEWVGHAACTIHCLLYTLAVALFAFWWMPWWGYIICFAAHWPVDRFRLARIFMKWTWHESFATGPLSPWSIIITDNVIHLIVLFVLGMLASPV